MPSATIRIFLVHGDPKRLRTAELSNWTGKAVAGPRSEIEDVLARDEADKPGVYFLSGVDVETGKPTIYIGEAESIRSRIKRHLGKDFWNHIVYFISKDENLTKAHIRFVEGRLIEQAHQAGRALVINGAASGAKLPESDREDMEVYLQKVKQLLPVLGVDLFVPLSSGSEKETSAGMLFCKIKGLQARGRLSPDGLVVLKDSQAVLEERASIDEGLRKLRDRLKTDGSLVENSGRLIFSRDVEFSSPSAAASVVHGGSANGLISWKDKDGKTLKKIESA